MAGTNKNTNSNKQVINLYLADLLRGRKRKKLAKRPKSDSDRQSEQPQPENLQLAMQRIRPAAYYPTNVIVSNPNNATTPSMFDIQKQSQANAYDNIRSSLSREIDDLRAQLQQFVNNGGNEEQANEIASLISKYQSTLESDFDGSNFDDQSLFSDGSSVYQYREPEKDINIDDKSMQVFNNEIFEPEPRPDREWDPSLPIPSNGSARAEPRPAWEDQTQILPTQADEANDPIDDVPSDPLPKVIETIDEKSMENISDVKKIMNKNIKKHPQKRVLLDKWQRGFDKLMETDYNSLSKTNKKAFKQEIRDYTLKYINDMINDDTEKQMATEKLGEVFKERKHFSSQARVLREIFNFY